MPQEISCALEAHLPATARSLSSKKAETDRPSLMLQATTMLTTTKTNRRWPASTRAPLPPQTQTKRNHNTTTKYKKNKKKKMNTRRRTLRI
jgi:hypothetical protein